MAAFSSFLTTWLAMMTVRMGNRSWCSGWRMSCCCDAGELDLIPVLAGVAQVSEQQAGSLDLGSLPAEPCLATLEPLVVLMTESALVVVDLEGT